MSNIPDINNTTEIQQSGLAALSRAILTITMAIIAALTALTHVAQIIGMTFRVYAFSGILTLVVVATIMFRFELSAQKLKTLVFSRKTIFMFLLCCTMGSCLALCCYRPDADDAYYVPNAVYYSENPDVKMDFNIHFIDSGGEPFFSPHFGSLPFEIAQAGGAYLTHLHFLTFYDMIMPALFGFMIPAVWFYVITRFSFSDTAALAAAFFVCLALMLMGEKNRVFGNFAFNRIFQGKAVMFSVVFPLFTALAMDYFTGPSMRKWLRMFFVITATAGLTTSSAFLMPLLGFLLATACSVAYGRNFKDSMMLCIGFFSSYIYLGLYAISMIVFSSESMGSNSDVWASYTRTFRDHAGAIFHAPVTNTFLIVASILSLLLLEKKHRIFLVVWAVMLAVCFANPLVYPFVMKHITTQTVYWRIFYLMPFPLVLALSVAAVTKRLEKFLLIKRNFIFAVVFALLLLAHIPQQSSSVFRSKTRKTQLKWPRHIITGEELVKKVLQLDPPKGTMLAPKGVCLSIGMVTSKYPQLRVRQNGIEMWMLHLGQVNLAVDRIDASNFLDGKLEISATKGRKALIVVVKRNPQLSSIVAIGDVSKEHDLPALLGGLGFIKKGTIDEITLYVRK